MSAASPINEKANSLPVEDEQDATNSSRTASVHTPKQEEGATLSTDAEKRPAPLAAKVDKQGKRVAVQDADLSYIRRKRTITDDDDRIEITEDDCYEELGFAFPTWKKWMILTIIFLVQVSVDSCVICIKEDEC
jgi:hypothetical protein